jgi:hypothetical protein
MASFTTDSIIIIHTKARSYKHWRYSYKIAHAKKVEIEYLDFNLCKVFGIQIVLFLPPEQASYRGYVYDGRWDDFDVLK